MKKTDIPDSANKCKSHSRTVKNEPKLERVSISARWHLNLGRTPRTTWLLSRQKGREIFEKKLKDVSSVTRPNRRIFSMGRRRFVTRQNGQLCARMCVSLWKMRNAINVSELFVFAQWLDSCNRVDVILWVLVFLLYTQIFIYVDSIENILINERIWIINARNSFEF